MVSDLSHPRVGILIENGVEDVEFQIPYQALQDAGARVVVIGSRMNDEYKGKQGEVSIKADATATEVRAEDFAAIVIPGGAAPDTMRSNPFMVRLIIDAMAQGIIVAAICHGPQLLVEADQLRGKQATGYTSIRKDMQNAGATYINEPVVIQGNLITSRRPGDLPVFTTTLLTRLGLSLADMELPDQADTGYEWWRLGEAWGGSSKLDIITAINEVIAGETYSDQIFEKYLEKASDSEIKTVLKEVRVVKQNNIKLLEARLEAFEASADISSFGGEALAKIQGWLQDNKDDSVILRRALGDVQTGVVDTFKLCTKLTDPITTDLFEQVESNLSKLEERLGDLYRARLGDKVQAPMPSSMALV